MKVKIPFNCYENLKKLMNTTKAKTHLKKRKQMKYGAVDIIISIFQVCTKYAITPSTTTLRENDSQSVIPANGRHFGPTYSDMRMNICTDPPGMKNPIKALDAM